MSETLLIAEKMAMRHHLEALKSATSQLERKLLQLPDLDTRTTALVSTGHIERSAAWRIATPEDIQHNINIFSQFTYAADQDAREARKFPAVIQLDPKAHEEIAQLLSVINQHKDALHQSNRQLKALVGKQSSEVWQEVQVFASIIQILRHISVIHDDLQYLGLSFMSKPIVKRMNKKDALKYIDEKIEFCVSRSSFMNKLSFLDDIRQQIADVDERRFEIKMARQGAPRFMVNAKSDEEDYQVMASMPVFVFSSSRCRVSLPAGRSRKRRADKRIPLGEIKSEFGIYLVPKTLSAPRPQI